MEDPTAVNALHHARVFIGLGANLGPEPRSTVIAGLKATAKIAGLSGARSSSLYRSAPVQASGPNFFNAVLEVSCSLTPHALLAQLQNIEARFGRERPYLNAPRTLDLDLLLFDEQVVHTPTLVIPHPRMHQRAFVLLPLLELFPAVKIPLQAAASRLLHDVRDQWIEIDQAPVEIE